VGMADFGAKCRGVGRNAKGFDRKMPIASG